MRGESTLPEPTPERRIRRARAVRRAGVAALLAFLTLGALNVFGVRSDSVTASGGGYELTVTYAAMTRPGLATPWETVVRRPGGFRGPVTVATTGDYFGMFDFNGLDPEPSATTATGDLLIWEFDPPPGDVLRISLDARTEPAVQSGRAGETAVLSDGDPVVRVRYTTRVMP